MARSPVLLIPNAAQVTLFFALPFNAALNVIGASHSGGVVFDQSLADALGASIKAAFTTHLAPHMTNNTQLARVGVRSLSSPALPMFRDTGAVVAGTAPGDALPAHIAQCITLRTARSGKSYRGRIYLGGWAESVNDVNGRQSSVASTAGVAFVQAVRDALVARNMVMAVLSKPAYEQLLEETTIIPGSDNVVRLVSHTTPKAGSFQNVTSHESITATWETQRRRSNQRTPSPGLLNPVASSLSL